MFHGAGQFPAPEVIDLPLGTHARQFYKTGPPFLQRHLPFWLAVLAQQLLVLLVPVVGVIYPLLRFSPSIDSWMLPGGLNEQTIATLEKWQCNPAQKDGHPVATLIPFEVNFRLY